MAIDTLSFIAATFSFLTLGAVAIAYHKLSGMAQSIRSESRAYADNTIAQVEGLMALYARVAGLPTLPRSRGWAASPDMLHNLVQLVQAHQPRVALECSSGLSTVVLANEMRRMGRGRVISLEHDSHYAEATRALLRAHQLQDWAEVVHAPLVEQSVNGWTGRWYDLTALPAMESVHLLVVDGPPSTTAPLARYPALPLLARHLAAEAIVLADDADRPDERAMVARWMHDVPGLERLQQPPCEKGCSTLVWPAR